MKTMRFAEFKRLCFCNSTELMNKVFLIGSKHFEWHGIGLLECEPDNREIVKIVE